MDSVVHNEPSQVEAEDGCVCVTGPGGVVVSFTPEAAAETSDRLLDGASRAMGQQLAKERNDRA
ncbi:hypothetical protein [Sphingomonas faeni]|uniref:hypothetical protein n=1 Tax=Sphingomonas faeni TaxID=185950 RepID=UPI0033574E67